MSRYWNEQLLREQIGSDIPNAPLSKQDVIRIKENEWKALLLQKYLHKRLLPHSVAIAAPWEIAKDKVERQLHYDMALGSVDSDRDVSVQTSYVPWRCHHVFGQQRRNGTSSAQLTRVQNTCMIWTKTCKGNIHWSLMVKNTKSITNMNRSSL